MASARSLYGGGGSPVGDAPPNMMPAQTGGGNPGGLTQGGAATTMPMPSQQGSAIGAGGSWFDQNMPQGSGGADGGVLSQTFAGNGGPQAPGGGYVGGNFTAPTGVNFMNDPAYQFNAGELNRGFANSTFAKGQGLTGGSLRDLQKYQSGLAANTYQQVFNNQLAGATFNRDSAFGNQDRALNSYLASRDTFWGDNDRLFGRNFSLASLGQNAASGLGNELGQYGANGGNLLVGQGNAAANGSINMGNAISGGINGGSSAIAQRRGAY